MRILAAVAITLLLMSVPAPRGGASAAGDVSDGTPSAADLLQAQRRAAEARRRLEIPRGPSGGWKRGGGGWRGAREDEAAPSPPARPRE